MIMSALITPTIKTLVQRVLNAAETGTADGAYHDVTILRDGKGGTRQITYGKSQTTEQGNLAKLIRLYSDKRGKYATQFEPYHPAIGVKPLVDDSVFKDLLRRAGKEDPVMRQAQDEFFDEFYWEPAFGWFKKNGFTLPLSMLVIYDSYIHSGRILDSLRKRFAEAIPAKGGNEKKWITDYTNVRHRWLANHSTLILRKTIYRTTSYLDEIARNNWLLEVRPIPMNGIAVNLPAGKQSPVA
jgi:chitosanase